MKIAVGILKRIGFLLLAALVFVGFVYPFFVVPDRYEEKARAMTDERIAEGGIEVDPVYIEESVNDAMKGSLFNIFREALILAAASALVVFCLSIRPPHDCGGINLFNPIYLIFTALTAVLTCASVHAVLAAQEASVTEAFGQFVENVTGGDVKRLLFAVMIPLVLELVFRGVIFSYLEKIHFSVALIVSPVLYAAAAYLIVGAYSKWSLGTDSPAMIAFWIALGIGFVNGVITWRLRSVIPAVLAHLFMVWSAPHVVAFCDSHGVAPAAALIALGVTLAVFVLLPMLFGKKVKVLAYDFPLTKHHEWMNGWLYGLRKKKAEKTAEEAPAEEKPAGEQPAEEAPAEEKPAGEQPAEEAPAEEKPAGEQPAEEAPADETAEENKGE